MDTILTLQTLPATYTIHRLTPDSQLPLAALTGSFYSLTQTQDEISLVCESTINVVSQKADPNWRALKVLGPLDFSLVGILAGLAQTLAAANISIFAISTYDTDYLLLNAAKLAAAQAVLRDAGYTVLAT